MRPFPYEPKQQWRSGNVLGRVTVAPTRMREPVAPTQVIPCGRWTSEFRTRSLFVSLAGGARTVAGGAPRRRVGRAVAAALTPLNGSACGPPAVRCSSSRFVASRNQRLLAAAAFVSTFNRTGRLADQNSRVPWAVALVSELAVEELRAELGDVGRHEECGKTHLQPRGTGHPVATACCYARVWRRRELGC